jgi:mRNA interferase MazF
LRLFSRELSLRLLTLKRGEIWWASLPEPSGSGPGLRRPVLVVQANPFNESRIATVIVLVITSNLSLADAPGNVRISKSESGLPKPSVINVSQVITIDRALLTDRVKTLPQYVVGEVNEGLRLVLAV